MYCCSISFTSFSACARISAFCAGTSMSSMAIEMPARVASRKPFCISWSAKMTVSRRPQRRNEALMRRLISFFFSARLSRSKGSPLGRISESRARPTVVSTRIGRGAVSPVSRSRVYSTSRTTIFVPSSTWLLS